MNLINATELTPIQPGTTAVAGLNLLHGHAIAATLTCLPEDQHNNMSHLIAISGCSSGGKSTLIEELAKRGYPVVHEPGRRIISQELKVAGTALPWKDPEAFARKAIKMASADLQQYSSPGNWVFFDRGLVDACSALAEVTGTPISEILAGKPRYNDVVFLTPPWPDIFVNDEQRTHTLAEATLEYGRLLKTYPDLGYKTVVLEKTSVEHRADTVLATLGKPLRR